MPLVAAILLLFAAVTAAGEDGSNPRYRIIDLGTLGGTSSIARDINERGQVVGFSDTAEDVTTRAFLWSPADSAGSGRIRDLGTVDGHTHSRAYRINNHGVVVGSAFTQAAGYDFLRMAIANFKGQIAVVFADTGARNIGSLGGTGCVATGVNDAGQVVGWSYTPGNKAQVGYRTAPRADIDPATDSLETLGGLGSRPNDIANSGVVVGMSHVEREVSHAFRTTARGKISDGGADLGTLGERNSGAYCITDGGQIVGWSNPPNSPAEHAVLYDGATIIDLGTLGGRASHAAGVNEQGQVVGRSQVNSQGDEHAFLFHEGKLIDLNTLVEADSGWTIMWAAAINNRGEIAATGYRGPPPGRVGWFFGRRPERIFSWLDKSTREGIEYAPEPRPSGVHALLLVPVR